MDRTLSDRERAVVEWMLAGDFEGAESYREQVAGLRVRGVCGCGCPSIDFVAPGTPSGDHVGRLGWIRGEPVLLEVFAYGGQLTGLEFTAFDGSRDTLPEPGDLVDSPPN